MLGLVLIYFIGKAFYELAVKHNRHKWLFALLGVFSYYLGTFLAGIAIVLLEPIFNYNTDNLSDVAMNFMGLPFGLLACFGFFKLLKAVWMKKKIAIEEDILDI